MGNDEKIVLLPLQLEDDRLQADCQIVVGLGHQRCEVLQTFFSLTSALG